ncbi:putative cyclin-dependent kinase [Diaporthe ampelina]|uniref:Putative cyclin-dependent kinase n=1 Tax=Diaporthe ampelina TaxID=1214573 RepID=A0A0G2FND1_9PEZI|nr:putative cyclin-dependent kinase [Diaporthe ampelina]
MIETAASDGGPGSGQGSSQESQLFQLSQLAAAQDKLPGQAQPLRSAVKRTADGTIKDPRFSPTASPGRTASHSRNTSAVSAASTASSRVTELSSELKTRLSYALLKVNNGWESRNINQVENLASGGVSPASSNSTIPGAPRSP